MELSKTFTFEASHILPLHPGKCSRLHGHSWVLRVYIKGEISPDTGFVMDYGDIKKCVQPIVDALDHRHLGVWTDIFTRVDKISAVPDLRTDFYPTSENLLMWIVGQLRGLDLIQIPNNPPELNRVWRPGEIVNTGPINVDEIKDVKRLIYWSRVELNETCTSAAILTREEYDGL